MTSSNYEKEVLRMTTYVLVGGAWLGGWCWQNVARQLRDDGHDAYPLTPTGLGERVHLASPQVDLDTHITDVVNLIEFEDLHDAVLLGHSYGGLVVTGAADRISERISQLVYLDTAPLPNGASLIEKFPPELRRRPRSRCRSLVRAGSSRYHRRKSWPTWPASRLGLATSAHAYTFAQNRVDALPGAVQMP
jgi:pimeloyl-ACP methyl ester carboxylesterase